MPKKYNAKQVEEILKEILNRAYATISNINTNLSVSDSDNLSEDEKKSLAIRNQLFVLTIETINDVISPAHEISLHFFKENEKFIKTCIENHAIFAKQCKEGGYVKGQE